MKDIKLEHLEKLFNFVGCIAPIMAICLYFMISGTVTLFYSGFALDSSGVLYLGTDAEIQKYYDGEMIGSIDPQARAYAFTIQKDDTILLSNASSIYTLDLAGNVLDKQEDVGTSKYNELRRSKDTFISQSNQKYVMKSQLGRTRICSDSEIIYQMPVLDFIVKIVFLLTLLSLLIFALISIQRVGRSRKNDP